MKTPLACCQLVVKKSTIQGYGVFAEQDIAPETIIEESHVIFTYNKESNLMDYYFQGKEANVLALGFGSIYNHSDKPNAKYQFDEINNLIVFWALKPIKRGDEILINYGANWFTSRRLQPKLQPLWYRFSGILPKSLRFVLIISLFVGGYFLAQNSFASKFF